MYLENPWAYRGERTVLHSRHRSKWDPQNPTSAELTERQPWASDAVLCSLLGIRKVKLQGSCRLEGQLYTRCADRRSQRRATDIMPGDMNIEDKILVFGR